jgi:siroheme synthase-like protein
MAIDVPLFPVGLVIAGRPCLVVGGGPVAARKVAALLTCGAAVTLVAPEVHRAIRALADAGTIAAIDGPPLDVQIRPYEQGEAAGYRLVLTATGIPAVDRAVAADAEAAGVWVNSADDTANCTVLLPAVHRDDPVTVAVATGGASPALATWLRHRIAEHLGTGLGELAHLLEQARHRMHARGGSTEDVDWRALLDGPIPELVRQGRAPEALVLLEAAVDAAAPTPPGAGA